MSAHFRLELTKAQCHVRERRAAVTSETARRLFTERLMPHLDDAYGLARWLTGNAADAEDVTQEACIRALAGIEQAQVGNMRAWLMTIVRNTAYTWLTRNRRKDVIASREQGFDPPDNTPSAEADMISKANAAAMERAIDALPLAFRETLVMREFSELSYRDIAEATGVPVGTVMSRLARARAMLAKTLREMDL